MTFRLRAMTPADVAAVAALHVATFNETHTVRNDGPSYALREYQWSKAFAEDDGSWFGVVIEGDNGELVGFAKGKPHDGGIPAYAGELNKIYLLRRYHRRGLGRKLLCWVARRFLERECIPCYCSAMRTTPPTGSMRPWEASESWAQHRKTSTEPTGGAT
jgi:L-amino acid N-acyltransferase YncA